MALVYMRLTVGTEYIIYTLILLYVTIFKSFVIPLGSYYSFLVNLNFSIVVKNMRTSGTVAGMRTPGEDLGLQLGYCPLLLYYYTMTMRTGCLPEIRGKM